MKQHTSSLGFLDTELALLSSVERIYLSCVLCVVSYIKFYPAETSIFLIRSPCLDEVVQLNDGTKHDGMATPFSQFHLLMISAFTTAE